MKADKLNRRAFLQWSLHRSLQVAGAGLLAPHVAKPTATRPAAAAGDGVAITGARKKWHKLTLTFDGPESSERATPNPFRNFRLEVLFQQGARVYRVPGYFAADGRAADTGAERGNQWRVHFAPDAVGEWSYTVSFRFGEDVAISDDPAAGISVAPDGASGTFTIADTDQPAAGRDLRGQGRLEYVGAHYLRFAESGAYFLKGGADSPENLLAYQDFDNTPNHQDFRKSWDPHRADWQPGDPTWQGAKGQGIIGALNYLAAKGMNAVSFLTMNLQGDDRNVFPYHSESAFDRFDCSKLDQWEIVFEHADHLGLYLHFKTQETENDQLLDGGDLGLYRRLYYRELIARFGHHLALNWNLGEENSQTPAQERAMAQYFADHDPYRHHLVMHTHIPQTDRYAALLGAQSALTGASLQQPVKRVYDETLRWVTESAAAGKKWVVANDEQAPASDGVVPDADDYWHNTIRHRVLWGNLMAGGGGVEYYFGYQHAHSDLTCQDYRSRDHMWDQTRYALDFFRDNVPFWEMSARPDLAANRDAWVFAKEGAVYVVYVPVATQSGALTLPAGTYQQRWFNPRTGEFVGAPQVRASAGAPVELGAPPDEVVPPGAAPDWVALLERQPD